VANLKIRRGTSRFSRLRRVSAKAFLPVSIEDSALGDLWEFYIEKLQLNIVSQIKWLIKFFFINKPKEGVVFVVCGFFGRWRVSGWGGCLFWGGRRSG